MCICLSLSSKSKGKGNGTVSDERFSVWKKYMFSGCRDQTQTHIDDDEAFIDYSHKGSEKGQQRRTKADNVAFALMSQSIWTQSPKFSFFTNFTQFDLHI